MEQCQIVGKYFPKTWKILEIKRLIVKYAGAYNYLYMFLRGFSMLNYVWFFILSIGIIGGIINGKIDEINASISNSATEAVEFVIGLVGIVAFWNGIIKILEDAGIVKCVSRLFSPVITKIFPGTKDNEKAKGAIITNFTANFFGLGNGATPSGIEAVKQMENNLDDVSKFLVINSAGLQLLPTTIIAMLSESGASNPSDIIIPTWIVSVLSMAAAILFFLIYKKIYRAIHGKLSK